MREEGIVLIRPGADGSAMSSKDDGCDRVLLGPYMAWTSPAEAFEAAYVDGDVEGEFDRLFEAAGKSTSSYWCTIRLSEGADSCFLNVRGTR